jgi:superfamily II DNA or RNA helicase
MAKLISKYVPECMKYKSPFYNYNESKIKYLNYGIVCIKSINNFKQNGFKYNIGVKDNNNYIINKYFLVSNCHQVAAKTFYTVLQNCYNAKMVVGMTATATGRSDGEDMKIIAAVGDIVYSIPIQKLTEDGYLVPAKVNILNIKKYQVGLMDEYRDIYTNGIVLNEERNRKAVDIAIKESSKGVVLIYIDIIEHGNIIMKLLKERKQKNVIFVHGGIKKRKKILQDIVNGKYKIVIGSKIYGTGINVPKFTTLVLVGGGRGIIKITQLVGRMLRLNEGKNIVNIYDFNDLCKNLKTHYQKRIKIYENLGFKINMEGE